MDTSFAEQSTGAIKASSVRSVFVGARLALTRLESGDTVMMDSAADSPSTARLDFLLEQGGLD